MVFRALTRQPVRLRPLTLALFSLGALAIGVGDHAFAKPATRTRADVRREIAARFPGVASVGTQELADWLADPGRERPLILDVRAREEYDVSHLPDAIWAGTTQRQVDALKQVPADRKIVVYCSVGWRSAEAALRLEKKGRRGVFNLDGSIFQWANEGRPLLDHHGKPVRSVHPYNKAWGALLDRGRWSHVP